MSLDTFEQSLLTELRQHVAAHRPDRRRQTVARLAWGGLAAAGAAAAVVGIVGASVFGPSPAYAVESQANGDVVVTVHDLADAHGLEQALAVKGVRADVTYVPSFAQDGGQSRATSGDGTAACDIALVKVDGGLRFTLGAGPIGTGATLDIVTSGSGPADVGSPVAVTWSGGTC
ncbi:hypothetical protein ACPPVS_12390 [Cellulomonas sp. McL0617]|uniref:hypothetical protein n=1 Tax=Cellulomonas sp. McL0617 TaxID=3415675 RepID=UPI003CF93AC4